MDIQNIDGIKFLDLVMPKSEFVKRSYQRQEKYFKGIGKTMKEGWIMSVCLKTKKKEVRGQMVKMEV